jgi:cell division protein FtsI/penicillin-binding protein 2
LKLSIRIFFAAIIFVVLGIHASAKSSTSYKSKSSRSTASRISESPRTQKKIAKLRSSRPKAKSASKRRTSKKTRYAKKRRYYERFYTSSYSNENTEGDITAGEDPIVRAAAIDALGNMNGTVLALDPDTGRILTMINQKLALAEGAMPCSTIKTAVALAALSEGVVTREEQIKLTRRWSINLTRALAVSNNNYFEVLGRRLGFEKVSHYAQQFGLGELAGYNIQGEHLGTFPAEEISQKQGGVGRMCSFGEGINMTPLQLGALTAAIANGGNLYYLQHPRSQAEVLNFQPKLKRTLNIAPHIPELAEGLSGAVDYGTARSVRASFIEEPILGKTGTCSKDGTRFGWFASYANTQHGRIVTVVFLRGGRPTYGPKAAEITGRLYRTLYDQSFFARGERPERAIGIGTSQ